MKIAFYQMNAVVGDLEANYQKIIQQINLAKKAQADIFITPELALTGYPPEDLLFRANFLRQAKKYLGLLAQELGITLIIGAPYSEDEKLFNSAFIFNSGKLIGRVDKSLLPNYGVFDECRYFKPGLNRQVFEINGFKCGILICEDLWADEPINDLALAGAEIIISLNASPLETNKYQERINTLKSRIAKHKLAIIYVNMVGAQDELVFDGASLVMNKEQTIIYQAPVYQELLACVELEDNLLTSYQLSASYPNELALVYNGLKLAISDYMAKNGFKKALLGLSGGVDSALVLALLVDACGAQNVLTVMLPTQYTRELSLNLAREMANLLEVNYQEINIENINSSFLAALNPLFQGLNSDTTEENLQARIRGVILMALSNKFNALLVNTGNKSELAMGYATLYGDMAGGFALLKDIPKSLVFALAKYRNSISYVIPEGIITRKPSAELKEDQYDQDSLPEYTVLDAMLNGLIDKNLGTQDLITAGFNELELNKVSYLLRLNEYKRRQGVVGPKITTRSFGRDWRLPITNKFNY